MPVFSDLLIYALIPGVAVILAGLWAALRPPNEYWRSALMHFAAGVIALGAATLLFLVTVELLTEVHEVEKSPWLSPRFSLGS